MTSAAICTAISANRAVGGAPGARLSYSPNPASGMPERFSQASQTVSDVPEVNKVMSL